PDAAGGRGLAGAVRAEEPGDGPGRDREAEGVHGGGVAVALGELACLDHDRDRSGGWGGTECSTANTETGDRAHGWRERRMVGRGAGSHVCCGVRSGSVLRLVVLVAGAAVRGQVQAERRMKARSSTSSPMERP